MVVVNDDVGRGGVVGARQNDFMGNGICEELCTLSLNVDEERLGSVKKEEEPGKIGTPRDHEDDQGDGRTDNGMCEQLSALSIKGEEEQLVSVKEEEEPGKIVTPNAEDDDQGYERTGNGMCEQLSSLPIKGDEEWLIFEKREKDPRKIARQYQIDICRKALEENVVVYLGTGCGKTHIAVLLIYEMGHLIKKPQKNICIFLAPTVALVQQQAKVIHDSLDFKVGTYYGNSTHLRSRIDCEKELEEKEIFVMTPQIMLHCLSHCLIKIELIALLIFDECHYAQLGSNHPYAEIMKIFYKVDAVKLPRIFGMTASPKLGKGASIDGLEALLRAKVYSVEDKSELGKFVTSPKVNIYYYCSSRNACSSPHMTYLTKLEEIKRQSISGLQVNSLDQSMLRSTKKLLQRLHSNLIFCLEGLGLWGALQASYNFSKNGYHCENGEPVEEEESYGDENLCKKYLQRASSVLASECAADGMEGDLSSVEVLKEPYFSRKLLQLIAVLSNFRLQPNMKCIIFVNRIVTARSLSYIIQNLKLLSSWRCEFLLGVHSGFMSHNTTNAILEKFRSGELNLLVATKVGEEGLDIQTCCLVIRFDLPETVASFIQSRGRARMPNSEYAFLVDRDNPHELNLIEHFNEDEAQMNEEISSRNSKVPITEFEEKTYKVDLTGATISSVSSVSLLHHYCSKLPHDEYFNPKPQFFYYEAGDGMVCNIVFPANAPIHQIVGAPQASIEAAKKDACLEACRNLHQVGALTDYLLPEEYDKSEKSTIDSADSEGNYEDSRAELHEMLVPAALTKPWTEVADSTCFSSYSVKLCPNPADRVYRKFGLFVTEPLPEEAGKMKLDLCLAHGRMVMTQLVPSGVAIFDKDEIAAAEMFQKICLKVVLDRNAFTPEYVPLENSDVYEPSTSTFYLLLPIVKHEYGKISVDWKLVKRFLSSPIFKQPHSSNSVTSQPGSCLHLANGCRSIQDVVDSLVYVPGKDVFFFVSDILQEKSGYSLFDESRTHVEYYAEVFGIHLVHPNQPLLRAKQLFILDNLLRKKKHKDKWREKEEHFVELPPEVCQLKVIGFSKDIGSSFSLLPSIMHRLENFLVAIELKDKLGASFPEGKEVTADRILEAITTAKCCEHFSLERLEVLGDAFLKLAVSRHLFLKHDALDEGQLTRKRSNLVNNSNLHRLAIKNNLQVYIRDYSLEVDNFFAFGRRCLISCDKETEGTVHSQSNENKNGGESEVRCNRCHHFLHNKTIADVVEALVGAFLIDSGFKAATGFLNWVGIDVDLSCSQIDNICSASNSFMALSNKIDVNPLENLLRYPFRHKGLLIQAFVHPSFNSHLGGCYQRLEFLGDAVLDYLITSYLYSVFPNLNPGRLTDLKSLSVNNVAFADVAARLSFHKFIICDSSVLRESMAKYVDTSPSATVKDHIEERSCPKALGDLVESCIGAIYLDTGFDLSYVWKTMLFLLHPVINLSKLQFNPVRELIELCQSYNWQVEFASLKGDGKFRVEAKVNEKNVSAFATHTSGKAAKKMAARQVYDLLEAEGCRSNTKSLDEVLRKSKKQEPRLLGYDETPFYRTPKCEVLENSEGDCSMKVYALNEKSSHTSCPVREHPSQDTVSPGQKQKFHRGGSKTDPPSIDLNTGRCSSTQGKTGSASNVSSKSRLYEICTANCWKAPVFDCVQEAGPDHVKEFIFKITIEIEETETGIVEIYSEARNRKKDAAENAAEGALWYLKHQGYIVKA